MFFLVRSAICIGAVVALLHGRGGSPGAGDIAEAARHAMQSRIEALCDSPQRCLSAGMTLVRAEQALADPTGPLRPHALPEGGKPKALGANRRGPRGAEPQSSQ